MAVETERRDLADRSAPQLFVGVALRNAEEELAGCAFLSQLPFRPERRPPDGVLEPSAGDVDRRDLVQGHGDVGPELDEALPSLP